MARQSDVKIGQIVWIPVTVKNGMFPTEFYFYWDISAKSKIAGYVTRDQIRNNKVRSVIVELNRAADKATLALPGELTRSNLVHVPIQFVREHAAP
jgi:hypothetical protein